MGSKTLKRLLSSVLSLSILCTQFVMMPVVAEAEGVSSTTEAEIILNAYSDQLSDEEKAVLGHDGIASNTVKYEAPTGPGNHVTLDDKVLTVTDYTDSQGKVWKPVLVELVEGGTRTPLTLTNGKVTINPNSPSYSIEVKYDLYLDIALETQTKLLNATYTLANGTKAIEILSVNAPGAMGGFDVSAQGKTMTQWLMSMIQGIEIQPNGFPSPITVYISDTVTIAAIEDMHAQATRTGSYVNGNYDLNVLAQGYNSADKIGHLLSSGASVVAEAKETRDQVLSIYTNQQMNSWYTFAGEGAEKDAIGIILGTAKDNADILMSVVGRSDADAEAGKYTEYADVINWIDVVLNAGLVADGADTVELTALVNAAVAANKVTDRTYTATNESLYVDTATVVLSLNNNDVTVKIEADVYNGSAKETLTENNDGKALRLPTGSSYEDVVKAVEEIENEFIAEYDDEYQLTSGNYDRVPETSVGDTLTEDSYFNIKYTPKNITVTAVGIEGIENSYPYGYGLVLPSGYEQNKAYTYTLTTESGSVILNEGKEYRITEPVTITRTEDKASKTYRVLALLADDANYSFTSAEKEVMKNSAVISDTVSYKIPEAEDADALIDLKVSDGTLVAYPYESGYNNLQWKPVGYYINGTGDRIDFDGTADNIPEGTQSVTVDYELVLIDPADTSAIEPLLTIASTLLEESSAQTNALDRLAEELSKLTAEGIDGATIFTALGALETYIYSTYELGDDTPWEDLDKEDQDVITTIGNIKNGALEYKDGTRKLVVEGYSLSYQQNGLSMYYRKDGFGKTGYDYFNEQLELLSVGLPAVTSSEKVKNFLQQDQYKSYADKLDKVSTNLGAVKAMLTPPSSDVDMKSDALSTLFALLETGGTISSQSAKGLTVSTNLLATDEGVETAKVTVTVNVMNLDGTVKETATVSKKYVVGQNYTDVQIAEIEGLQTTAETELTSNLDFYKSTIAEGAFPTVGSPVTAANIVITYEPMVVSVSINGEHVKNITGNDLSIPLPNHPDAGWKYVYSINGQALVAQDGIYTVSSDNFKAYAETGLLEITRTEENVGETNLKDMFVALNDGLGNGSSKYILVSDEAGSSYAVVLRLDAHSLSSLTSNLQDFVMTLATKCDYTYQAFGDNVYWNSPKVSVQAIIDTLLESDLSMSKVNNVLDSNGNIIDDVANEITNYTKVIVGSSDDVNNLGASLIETTLNIGVEGPEISMPFYLSIEDFGTTSSAMSTLKNGIAKVSPYLDVNTDDDVLNTIVNAPDRLYQAVLAGLLVTGYADLDDITDVQLQNVMEYVREQLNIAILDDSISSTTYQNTLNKLNVSADLSEYADTIDNILTKIRSLREYVTIVDGSESYSDNKYSATFDANIEGLMNSLGYGDFVSFLAEKNVNIPTSATLTNIGTSYEAAIFDNSEEGLDKVYFAKDLSAVSEGLGSNAVVVLLSDVNDAVVLGNGIILDLNGKTIASLTSSNGTTKIFNSAFDADGGVSGAITGDFKIAGGKYTANVSSMVVAGYSQTNGVVESDLYTAKMDGDNLVVELEADFIDPAREADLKYLGVDLAVQLALNFYTASKLNVAGNDIYAFEYDDLIDEFMGNTDLMNEALDIIDYAGLTAFANRVIDDLTNWGAMAAAVESGNPLVTYGVTTNPWGVELIHVESDDYLSASLKSDDSVNDTFNLVIKVRGEASDSDNVALAKLLREFEKVLTVDAEVALNDISYTNEDGFTVDYYGDGSVVIDFTEADNGSDYTTLMGMILSYGNPDNTALKDAVQNYITNGDVDGLIAEVDNLTIAQVITSIKAVRGVSYSTLKNGFTGVESSVKDLESIYHVILQGVSAVVNKLDVTGNGTKLAAIGSTDSDGKYVYTSEEQSWKNITGIVTLKLFAEKAPELVAYAKVNAQILGWEIDYTNKELKYDFAVTETANGLELNKFGNEFYTGFVVNNGVLVSVTFDQDTINAGLLRNGSEAIVMYAKSEDATPIEETWTIKVVGDVNCNGLIESNDAALIAKKFIQGDEFRLEDVQMWAADVNDNGSLESNDALQNAYKWTLQTDKYTSKLKNVEEGK